MIARGILAMENKSSNNFISYVGLEEHEMQVITIADHHHRVYHYNLFIYNLYFGIISVMFA